MYGRIATETPDGDWRSFKHTIATGETFVVGTLYLINDTWGMAYDYDFADAETITDDEVVLIYNCEKIWVDKGTDSGDTFNPGDKVYVHHTTKLVSDTNSANHTCIGICVHPAVASDTKVLIDLKGDSMTDQA